MLRWTETKNRDLLQNMRKYLSENNQASPQSITNPALTKNINDTRYNLAYCPLDKAYYRAIVQSVNQSVRKFKLLCDDLEKEIFQISKEEWMFADTNHAIIKTIQFFRADYSGFKNAIKP